MNTDRRHLSLQALMLGFCLTSVGICAQPLLLAQTLINFNSSEGEKLLLESNARQDYFPLSIQFVTQDHLAYCGVASIVMILNALSIAAPEDSRFGPYRFFTQENVFNNPQTQQVMTAETVATRGMTLEQLSQLLESYSLKTAVYHGGNITLEKFRQLVVENLAQPNNFVIVNYLRQTIGQDGGGHISPVAAYDEESDRFLILDVSRYKYPPVWVKAENLWQAINTPDSTSGQTRGFVLVSPGYRRLGLKASPF